MAQTLTWLNVFVAEDQRIVPFATATVLPIAGLAALLHCVAGALGNDYWFDEVYMLAIGRHHLDWGSADQPPVVPALAAVMDTIAPGSLIALRLPAVVATAAAVVVAGLIARELGCDRRAQGFTAAAQATVIWTSLAGHWLTPYSLEPVQWLLLMWLLVRWIRLRDDRVLLAAGVVVGVAALTKFQVVLLCVVLLGAIAAVVRATFCAGRCCGRGQGSRCCSRHRHWCGSSTTAGPSCRWPRWWPAKRRRCTAVDPVSPFSCCCTPGWQVSR
ncbi:MULTISPECIES: glycosyltransferase family 39 protein [unclassified Mycobacterium]|uniref:glycosyltransferase family 39 protein n=1 Tax=unclassified Mycobacterium TaxID=2642494 RepID=UPI001E5CA08B|nr:MULTISPECIES: glycosyltransferase family 39 protein [unclassified Mycobacterium]